MVLYLLPIVAGIFGVLFLDEPIGFATAIGAIVTLGGVYVVRRADLQWQPNLAGGAGAI